MAVKKYGLRFAGGHCILRAPNFTIHGSHNPFSTR
jgi:hypothetical protein